jgi:hypothetical protein
MERVRFQDRRAKLHRVLSVPNGNVEAAAIASTAPPRQINLSGALTEGTLPEGSGQHAVET